MSDRFIRWVSDRLSSCGGSKVFSLYFLLRSRYYWHWVFSITRISNSVFIIRLIWSYWFCLFCGRAASSVEDRDYYFPLTVWTYDSVVSLQTYSVWLWSARYRARYAARAGDTAASAGRDAGARRQTSVTSDDAGDNKLHTSSSQLYSISIYITCSYASEKMRSPND